VAQPDQSLFFDLPYSPTCDAENRANLLKNHQLLIIKSEVESWDFRFPFLKRRKCYLNRITKRTLIGLLFRAWRILVRKIVEKATVLSWFYQRIEGKMRVRYC
jgi:hypothetical protein